METGFDAKTLDVLFRLKAPIKLLGQRTQSLKEKKANNPSVYTINTEAKVRGKLGGRD